MIGEPFAIFIFCDDPAHAPRKVAVTNFVALPGGGWHEKPASRASRGHVGTGYNLVSDTPAEPGWALDPEVSNADVRDKFELACRKCKGQPRGRAHVRAQRETLFGVLDGWRESGVSEVPLALVAASVGRTNRSDT